MTLTELQVECADLARMMDEAGLRKSYAAANINGGLPALGPNVGLFCDRKLGTHTDGKFFFARDMRAALDHAREWIIARGWE